MSQIFAYEREPYRTELGVTVLETGEEDGRPFAVLDDTILFPEGGGQPPDHGRLGSASVLDVQRREGAVRHFLDNAVEPGPAKVTLDWERRYELMQQHTAQHLLTAVTLERFGWRTTAFHIRPEVCDIELDVPSISSDDLQALEDAVAKEIRAHRAVKAWRVTPEEYSRLEVRSRGLPSGHHGDVRLVEIEGVDLNTCGGTHLSSTAEIEMLKLLGTESLRGGTLLLWIAGSRARRRLAAHEARSSELRKLFSTGDEELVDTAALKLAQLKQAQRRQKQLEKQLAEVTAEGLVARGEPVMDAHFDDAGMDFLQQVARRFSASPISGLLFSERFRLARCFFRLGGGSGLRRRPARSRLGGRARARRPWRRFREPLSGQGGVPGQAVGRVGLSGRRRRLRPGLRTPRNQSARLPQPSLQPG